MVACADPAEAWQAQKSARCFHQGLQVEDPGDSTVDTENFYMTLTATCFRNDGIMVY